MSFSRNDLSRVDGGKYDFGTQSGFRSKTSIIDKLTTDFPDEVSESGLGNLVTQAMNVSKESAFEFLSEMNKMRNDSFAKGKSDYDNSFYQLLLTCFEYYTEIKDKSIFSDEEIKNITDANTFSSEDLSSNQDTVEEEKENQSNQDVLTKHKDVYKQGIAIGHAIDTNYFSESDNNFNTVINDDFKKLLIERIVSFETTHSSVSEYVSNTTEYVGWVKQAFSAINLSFIDISGQTNTVPLLENLNKKINKLNEEIYVSKTQSKSLLTYAFDIFFDGKSSSNKWSSINFKDKIEQFTLNLMGFNKDLDLNYLYNSDSIFLNTNQQETTNSVIEQLIYCSNGSFQQEISPENIKKLYSELSSIFKIEDTNYQTYNLAYVSWELFSKVSNIQKQFKNKFNFKPSKDNEDQNNEDNIENEKTNERFFSISNLVSKINKSYFLGRYKNIRNYLEGVIEEEVAELKENELENKTQSLIKRLGFSENITNRDNGILKKFLIQTVNSFSRDYLPFLGQIETGVRDEILNPRAWGKTKKQKQRENVFFEKVDRLSRVPDLMDDLNKRFPILISGTSFSKKTTEKTMPFSVVINQISTLLTNGYDLIKRIHTNIVGKGGVMDKIEDGISSLKKSSIWGTVLGVGFLLGMAVLIRQFMEDEEEKEEVWKEKENLRQDNNSLIENQIEQEKDILISNLTQELENQEKIISNYESALNDIGNDIEKLEKDAYVFDEKTKSLNEKLPTHLNEISENISSSISEQFEENVVLVNEQELKDVKSKIDESLNVANNNIEKIDETKQQELLSKIMREIRDGVNDGIKNSSFSMFAEGYNKGWFSLRRNKNKYFDNENTIRGEFSDYSLFISENLKSEKWDELPININRETDTQTQIIDEILKILSELK